MMKKRYLVILTILIVAVGTTAILMSQYTWNKKDLSVDRDLALEIGSIILCDRFPYLQSEKFVIYEYSNKWRIEKELEPFLENVIRQGGGYYIELSKKDGRILDIGIED